MPPYQPEIVGSTSHEGSTIYLPGVRIGRRTLLMYTIILIITIIAMMDSFKTFIINERALLTSRGRELYRTRRRAYDKARLCDESDEPRWQNRFQFKTSGWRALSTCVEFDLSLRKRQLGDIGVKRLVSLLERKEYATKYYSGQLRVLNLERQGITRRGAGYLARWLSVEPIQADDNSTSGLVDVDRMPTAAYRSISINLEGNPIGLLGVKDLERAVDKARINGIRVVIVGGGSSSDDMLAHGGKRGQHQVVGHQHVVKLGPIEYTRKSVEMTPWRLPIPWYKKVRGKVRSHPVMQGALALIVFSFGFSVGRRTSGMVLFPYRVVIVRSDG